MSSPDEATSEAGQLRRENEELLEFLYLVPVGLAQIDVHGEVVLMNSHGSQLLMPLADGPNLTNLFDVLDPFVPELRNVARLHGTEQGTIIEGRRVDLRALGRTRGPGVLAVGLVQIDGARVMAVVQDVTRTVDQERRAHADRERFKAIYEGMRDAMICTLDATEHIDSWNASGERLFGFIEEEMRGRRLDELIDASGEATHFARARDVRQTGWSEIEGWCGRKDNPRFWGEGVVSALRDEAGEVNGYAVVLRDMTDRKVAEERLRQLATTDALTGLANRRFFAEEAEKELVRRQRYGGHVSLLMIDADRFKSINDTHGHAAGDEVLRHLATTLRATLRTTDLPARFGGEELVVLLPETTLEGAAALAERIRGRIAEAEVHIDGARVRYTVSIGVSTANESAIELRTLLRAADEAVYRAKGEGRNRVALMVPA